MSRVRLTQRKAADASIPYPGNVNQERNDPAWEKYHTFEQRVNHELPDMRHEWQDDERDDIGFGISEPWGQSPTVPTVASVRVAANKAVRIAVLLLGEKVEDEVIEAQARDLMAMNPKAMDRTLSRFADTQKLYAEDEDEADEKKAADEKDEKKEAADEADEKDEKKAADEKKDEPPAFIQKKIDESKEKKGSKELAEGMKAEDKPADEKKAEEAPAEEKKDAKCGADEEKKEDKVEARLAKLETMISSIVAAVMPKKAGDVPPEFKEQQQKMKDKAEEKKAGEAEFTPAIAKPGAEAEAVKAEEKPAEEKKAEDKPVEEKKAEDKPAEEKEAAKAADEAPAEEKKEAKKAQGPNEMDIELTGAMDEGEEEVDPETASQLASLFDDGVTATEELPEKEASKKAGIKKLGGQPRVASAGGAGVADISSIWETAPDVSEVFK